jgi:hypothetical protein
MSGTIDIGAVHAEAEEFVSRTVRTARKERSTSQRQPGRFTRIGGRVCGSAFPLFPTLSVSCKCLFRDGLQMSESLQPLKE